MSTSKTEYPIIEPPQYVYRVGYGTDPSQLRPPGLLPESEPSCGRFDDPNKTFRVLYTARSPSADVFPVYWGS